MRIPPKHLCIVKLGAYLYKDIYTRMIDYAHQYVITTCHHDIAQKQTTLYFERVQGCTLTRNHPQTIGKKTTTNGPSAFCFSAARCLNASSQASWSCPPGARVPLESKSLGGSSHLVSSKWPKWCMNGNYYLLPKLGDLPSTPHQNPSSGTALGNNPEISMSGCDGTSWRRHVKLAKVQQKNPSEK